MEIQDEAVVSLSYELKVSKTEDNITSEPFTVEVRDESDPFLFLAGNSGLPEKFESQLKGKKATDKFQFMLEVEEAYGYADDTLIMTLPVSEFSEENGFKAEMLEAGNFLPLIDDQGHQMQAKVIKNMGEELLLDFNHPLVGFELYFEGVVLEVREATEVEKVQGIVLPPDAS